MFYTICNLKSKHNNLDGINRSDSSDNEISDSQDAESKLVQTSNKIPEISIKQSNKKKKLINNCSNMLLKPVKNELSISSSRLVANMYKDSLKCSRNKKYDLIKRNDFKLFI